MTTHCETLWSICCGKQHFPMATHRGGAALKTQNCSRCSTAHAPASRDGYVCIYIYIYTCIYIYICLYIYVYIYIYGWSQLQLDTYIVRARSNCIVVAHLIIISPAFRRASPYQEFLQDQASIPSSRLPA